MGWGERYVLHPGRFGVRVLPPGSQPEEGPPVMRSLPSREGGWEGDGRERDKAGGVWRAGGLQHPVRLRDLPLVFNPSHSERGELTLFS